MYNDWGFIHYTESLILLTSFHPKLYPLHWHENIRDYNLSPCLIEGHNVHPYQSDTVTDPAQLIFWSLVPGSCSLGSWEGGARACQFRDPAFLGGANTSGRSRPWTLIWLVLFKGNDPGWRILMQLLRLRVQKWRLQTLGLYWPCVVPWAPSRFFILGCLVRYIHCEWGSCCL